MTNGDATFARAESTIQIMCRYRSRRHDRFFHDIIQLTETGDGHDTEDDCRSSAFAGFPGAGG